MWLFVGTAGPAHRAPGCRADTPAHTWWSTSHPHTDMDAAVAAFTASRGGRSVGEGSKEPDGSAAVADGTAAPQQSRSNLGAPQQLRRRQPQLEFKQSALETTGVTKRFTTYTMQVSLLGHSWEVSKRYSEFDELRAKLEQAYVPHVVPKSAWPAFPQKRILGNFDANVISTRSAGLQAFMQQLLLLSPVCDEKALLDFLQAPSSAMTSSAIDSARRRYYKRVSAWHAAPGAPEACGGTAVTADDVAQWAWERGLENSELSDVWSQFADASARLDPLAPRAAILAQARVRGRNVRRQQMRQHACATLVQQYVRQRRLSSPAMLSSDERVSPAVSWQLRGISAISASRAPDAPMFRCTSAPFAQLGRRWQLCAQIDRSADTVGLFLREADAQSPGTSVQQPTDGTNTAGGSDEHAAVSFSLELVGHGPGGQIVLAQHRKDECRFGSHDGGVPAWGKLRMATLQVCLLASHRRRHAVLGLRNRNRRSERAGQHV